MVPSVTDQPKTPTIIVEEGEDPSHLVIAFTGLQGGLNVTPFDFFSATGLLSSSRILLRDPSNLLYLTGVGSEAPTFWTLLERLRAELARLNPERVTCVGTSSGGYAALLFGHLLEVDQVHAFGPTIQASVLMAAVAGDWHQVLQMATPQHLMMDLRIPLSVWKFRRLDSALRKWNGRTNYTIHVCEQFLPDVKRVAPMRGLPHIEIAMHPCKTHAVARHLIGERKLLDVIRKPV
jgi:hypothetical protein